jgi:translocation and assembly module TamA
LRSLAHALLMPKLPATFRHSSSESIEVVLPSTRLPAILFCAALSAQGLAAQEVLVELPPGSEDLRSTIERDSLTFTLEDVAPGSAQDYIAAARSDYQRILTVLYAEGRYGGTISILIDGREAAGILPLDAPDRINQIRIIVEPGPLFTFGRADVGPLPAGTLLPESFATGETARSGTIGDAVQAGVESWQDAGHAKAAPGDQQIRALHEQDVLDVSVTLQPGPILTFGTLTVTGNEAVRTERILAIAGLPTGQVFSPQDVQDAADRLRRTGAFASVVVVESETISPGNTLDFTLNVNEMPPRRIGFGAEYSTLDGLSLNGFWLHRNLLGGAEELRIEAEVTGLQSGVEALESRTGGTDATLQATLTRPGTFRPDTDLEFALALERLDEPNYQLDSFGIGVGLTRYVSDDLTYEGQVELVTVREETEIGVRNYTLLVLPLNAELDRRDEPLDAKSGYYINLEASPYASVLGESDNGIQLVAETRYYYSIGPRLTFAGRGQIGSLISRNLDSAPANFLFYSGGTGTVRGESYNSLGVTVDTIDANGDPVTIVTGGASFLGAQLEARIGVTDGFSVVGFYDGGFVDSASMPSTNGEYHAGAGIGVRYATPIGPIRLDIATPAYGDDAGQSVEFYLGIGQAF